MDIRGLRLACEKCQPFLFLRRIFNAIIIMEKFCVSIDLAPTCCNSNYLQYVCRSKVRVFRGRKYEFMWDSVSLTAGLVCDGVFIGVVYKGSLGIFPKFAHLGLSKSSLGSLIALFNLYPL